MTKTKTFVLGAILASSIIFGGCSSFVAKPASLESESPDVTLTGTLVKAGNKYAIDLPNRSSIEIDTRQVNFTDFVGKEVTVTGQYSGTTLFVSKIQ